VSDDRRYDDDEVREIFGLAAEAGEGGLPPATTGQGLTLAELRRIGPEVGLSPDRIAAAAARLDFRRGAVREPTYLGLPLSVGLGVELPRALTDREWEVLVGEARETFGARGRVTGSGQLREWSNGNLHMVLEATATGHRVRLHTTKGTARNAMWMGVTLMGLAVVLFGLLLVTGQVAEELFAPAFLGILGAAALGSNALILPPWARDRERQMEHLAARALELAEPERED